MSVRGENDSQSDYTGRGSSLASRDDISEVAALLGIPDTDLIATERFRVDRKRLECLLFEDENPNAANDFFDNIMIETNTKVVWPSKLKLGAKSRKDPHVKVMGLIEGVEIARKKIAAVLDMRSSRVTMKIDVSYTDHSHIIGKGGLSIKRVMEETKCHIHFPDSNRSNTTEKSNQVSITGIIGGVELARCRIRELMPLIFCFDLPMMGVISSIPELSDPFIKSLEETYNVQVMFRSRQKLNSTLIVVKGFEWEVKRVKEATQILISHTCESYASQIQVHMMLEISPNHQSVVLGKNNENIKEIMKRTSTQIIFVDPNDPNIPKIKKSNVTITGSIDNVYLARQQLIGSLPVVLIFDVPDNSIVVDCEKMEVVMNNLDVFITTKNKFKQNFISFIIKGIERNVVNVYEARRQLLGLNEEPIQADIPLTYLIPNAGSTFRTNYCEQPYSVSSPLVAGGPNMFEFQWPANTCQRPQVYQPPVCVHCAPPTSANLGAWNTLAPELGHLSHSSLSLPDMPEYSSGISTGSNMSNTNTGSRAASPILQMLPDKTKQKLVGSDSQLHNVTPDWRAPGCERKNTIPDYQQIKMQAVQALQQGICPGEVRVPTSAWSGHGFSQSSPYSFLKEMKAKQEEHLTQHSDWDWDGNASGETRQEDQGQLATSNYLESVALTTRPIVDSGDLRTLLASVGLEKYMSLFINNEVDLETFRTLTEEDLKDIGVSAFGARRKLAVCIAELNRHNNPIFDNNSTHRTKKDPPPGFKNW